MADIHVLDSDTIDKIAAGEVVERPASVVKELVENAIDAKALCITVEVKDGGIEFIRVTDDGQGISKDQIRLAFFRHATSKITDADDLFAIHTLGFRGEALSSIAAVSKVELITKTVSDLVGIRYFIEGGQEGDMEEVGAPDGTTFLVRNLFYNTPVRRKFLKSAATEFGYISDLMEHIAISHPNISFKLMNGSKTVFSTSGNGNLKEAIYRIYGREVSESLISIGAKRNGIELTGFLGKPIAVRASRNNEIYFINGRYIKSNSISLAIEEGYKEYLMQHKFPMCFLNISIDPANVDVNVHPTKMDVRINDGSNFFSTLSFLIADSLKSHEMIPEVSLLSKEEEKEELLNEKEVLRGKAPEPFEFKRREVVKKDISSETEVKKTSFDFFEDFSFEDETNTGSDAFIDSGNEVLNQTENKTTDVNEDKDYSDEISYIAETVETDLFKEKILTKENAVNFKIIGQVFNTYWIIEYDNKMMIIDQHAAHEKVKYERLVKAFKEKTIVSEGLLPPVIVSLSGTERAAFNEYEAVFKGLGFEIEHFGGNEYAMRAVPMDLYGCDEEELFLSILSELMDGSNKGSFKVVEEKLASMACKAAVKGNNRLSEQEAMELIKELLTLENPYNCPHGRPTIIVLSQSELEKKFKRIV